MSARKLVPLSITELKRGMHVQATQTWQSGVTQVTEGRVSSVGNGTTILLGDTEHYAEIQARRPDAATEWHLVIDLPDAPEAVVLVKQPSDRLQVMIRTGADEWRTPLGTTWTNDQILTQLDRVLWDGVQP